MPTANPVPELAGVEATRFVEMVFPEHANHYGTLFGGMALNLMGKAAFVAAVRHARCSVVMARSERISFEEPVRVGELVELVARVVRVGRSAMTVAVDLVREDILSGDRRTVVHGSFEMVAVDAAGRPIRIPQPAAPSHAGDILQDIATKDLAS